MKSEYLMKFLLAAVQQMFVHQKNAAPHNAQILKNCRDSPTCDRQPGTSQKACEISKHWTRLDFFVQRLSKTKCTVGHMPTLEN